MTLYCKFLFLIKRLAGIFSHDERQLIEAKTGQPMKYYLEDGCPRYASLTTIRSLVKQWKASNHNNEFSEPQYQEILRVIQQGMDDINAGNVRAVEPQEMREEEKPGEVQISANTTVLWTEQWASRLPQLTGYLVCGDGRLQSEAIVVDTGASLSIISANKFRELGLTSAVLDTQHNFKVDTAAGKCGSLGIWKTYCFLRSGGKYYKLELELLVLESNLDKILIGIPTLRKSDYRLQYNKGEELLKLKVLTSGNRWQVRTFRTFYQGELGHQMFTCEVSAGQSNAQEEVQLTLCCEDDLEVTDLSLDVYKGEEQVVKNLYCERRAVRPAIFMTETPAGPWIKSIKHYVELNLARAQVGDLMEGDEAQGVGRSVGETELEDTEVLFAEAMDNLDHIEETETAQASPEDGIEEEVLKRLGAFGLEEEKGDHDRYWEPDLSGLPEEVREKFRELFESYKDVFAKDKYSVPAALLPEVSLQLKPGATPHADKPRFQSPAHNQILIEIVEKMVQAGYLEEITGQPGEISQYNHAIFLVEKKMDLDADLTSKMENRSPEARLERLRRGARAVSDMRGLNQRLVECPPLLLPTFASEVRLFAGSQSSVLDICSGFYQLRYDKESRPLTQFVIGDRVFRYLRLIMGAKNSPAIFSYLMGTVVNKKDFDSYMASVGHPETLQANFYRSVARYVDDISLNAAKYLSYKGFFLMFHLWSYILRQFRKYRVTLSAAKIVLGKEELDVLGFTINIKDSCYRLSRAREKAFKDMKHPRNPAQLRTLLCTLSYFDRCLLNSRAIVVLLSILSLDQQEYHYTASHQREFLCLLFTFDLNLSVQIPQPHKPLFLSSDASWASWAGNLWQLDAMPEGEAPPPGEEEGDRPTHLYRLAGIYSRAFPSAALASSILSKELTGFFSSILYFYDDLQANQAGVMLFCDFQALSLMVKLRHSNSRMAKYNLLLSSLKNTSLCISKSASTNFLCDLISRLSYNQEKMAPQLVPGRFLDNCGEDLKEFTVLSPQQVKYITELNLPQIFMSCPRRTQMPVSSDLQKLAMLGKHRVVVEEEICKAIFYGYQSIPKNSSIFKNAKTGKLIPEGEYRQLGKTYHFEDIKKYLHFTRVHSYCETDPEAYLDKIKTFLQILSEFMVVRNLHHIYANLYQEIECVRGGEITLKQFYHLYNRLSKAEVLGVDQDLSGYGLFHFVTFVTGKECEVKFERKGKQLGIVTKGAYTLEPDGLKTVMVQAKFVSHHGLEFRATPQDGISIFISSHYKFGEHFLHNIILYNAGETTAHVVENSLLCEVLVHAGDPCRCGEGDQVVFIQGEGTQFPDEDQVDSITVLLTQLVKLDARHHALPGDVLQLQEDDGQEENPTVPVMTAETPEWADYEDHPPPPQGKMMKNIVRPGEATPLFARLMRNQTLLNSPAPQKKDINEESYINRLIFLGSLYGDPSQLCKVGFVVKMQDSCKTLREIKQKVLQGRADNFILKKGVLYRTCNHRKIFKLQLCLSSDAYRGVVDSVHGANRHLSPPQMQAYLSQYFYAVEDKKIILESANSCGVCLFNLPCRRTHFTNRPDHSVTEDIGAVWSLDFMQDLPPSHQQYRYLLLCVENTTGYLVLYKHKTLTGGEIKNSLENLIRMYNIPSKLRFDFAGGFRDKSVLNFLHKHHIQAIKSCPQRSQEAGSVERAVNLVRHILSGLILHEGGERWNLWCSMIVELQVQYNNLIYYNRENPWSRSFLMFGPLHHKNYRYPASSPDWGNYETQEEERCKSFYRIMKARERFAKKYKILDKSHFPVGTYVIAPDNKQQKAVRHGNSGVPHTVKTVYQVVELNENSARLVDIFGDGEVTKSFGDLVVLPPTWLSYIRKYNLLEQPGSFNRNIFKPGQSPLVKQIVAGEAQASRLDQSGEEMANDGGRSDNDDDDDDDDDDEMGEEPLSTQGLELNAEETEQEIQQFQQQRYNLRSRGNRPVVLLSQVVPGKPGTGKTGETRWVEVHNIISNTHHKCSEEGRCQTTQQKKISWSNTNSRVEFRYKEPVRNTDNKSNLYGFKYVPMRRGFYLPIFYYEEGNDKNDPDVSLREASIKYERRDYQVFMSRFHK